MVTNLITLKLFKILKVVNVNKIVHIIYFSPKGHVVVTIITKTEKYTQSYCFCPKQISVECFAFM